MHEQHTIITSREPVYPCSAHLFRGNVDLLIVMAGSVRVHLIFVYTRERLHLLQLLVCVYVEAAASANL